MCSDYVEGMEVVKVEGDNTAPEGDKQTSDSTNQQTESDSTNQETESVNHEVHSSNHNSESDANKSEETIKSKHQNPSDNDTADHTSLGAIVRGSVDEWIERRT